MLVISLKLVVWRVIQSVLCNANALSVLDLIQCVHAVSGAKWWVVGGGTYARGLVMSSQVKFKFNKRYNSNQLQLYNTVSYGVCKLSHLVIC